MCANRKSLAQHWRRICAAPMGCTKDRALAQKLRHPLAYRRGLGARSLVKSYPVAIGAAHDWRQ